MPNIKITHEKDRKADPAFLKKLVEFEPNASFRAEIRDEGPPYFGEEGRKR